MTTVYHRKDFLPPRFHPPSNKDDLFSWAVDITSSLSRLVNEMNDTVMQKVGIAHTTTQQIAAGFTVNNDGLIIFLVPVGAVSCNATVAIMAGTDGQLLILVNAGTSNITFIDTTTTSFGSTKVIAPNECLLLVWNSLTHKWNEVAKSS